MLWPRNKARTSGRRPAVTAQPIKLRAPSTAAAAQTTGRATGGWRQKAADSTRPANSGPGRVQSRQWAVALVAERLPPQLGLRPLLQRLIDASRRPQQSRGAQQQNAAKRLLTRRQGWHSDRGGSPRGGEGQHRRCHLARGGNARGRALPEGLHPCLAVKLASARRRRLSRGVTPLLACCD